MNLVEADGLAISFQDRVIVAGLDLTIETGDHMALVGRSGSGKTSLLLVLAGFLEPSGGRLVRHLPPEEVGYVPQAPSLLPELTAVQNASLGLRLRGTAPPEAEARAREQLYRLGVDAEDALPHELSGGMQARVALARALALAPTLLLADEPTAALDRATGERVLDVLVQQTTLVVATHEPTVAERLPRLVDLAQVAA